MDVGESTLVGATFSGTVPAPDAKRAEFKGINQLTNYLKYDKLSLI